MMKRKLLFYGWFLVFGALLIAQAMAIQSPVWGRWAMIAAVGLPFSAVGILGLVFRGPDPVESAARVMADPAQFNSSFFMGIIAFLFCTVMGVLILTGVEPVKAKVGVVIAPWSRWVFGCISLWAGLAGAGILWIALKGGNEQDGGTGEESTADEDESKGQRR